MKIRYLGHSCFELTADNGTKVITDPYRGVGYELSKGLYADIVTLSHQHFDHNYTEAIVGNVQICQNAELYTKNGVEISGIKTYHDPEQGRFRGENIIFKFEVDGITVCHFGDLGESCSAELLAKIGAIDVLLIPVGGTYTIDCKQAKEYADKLSAKKVIPMHYRPKDGALDIAEIGVFLSQYPSETIEFCPQGEILLTRKDLNESKKQILYMERVL